MFRGQAQLRLILRAVVSHGELAAHVLHDLFAGADADLGALHAADAAGDGMEASDPDSEFDSSGRVNINIADLSSLQTLPGIGPSKAQSIIDYREQNGYFTNIEEIMFVSGIGEKTFASIKDQIVV